MIPIKSEEEIRIMTQGGAKLRKVLDFVLGNLKPGLTTARLDKIAEKRILASGGKPSFKMVPRYRWASCININQGVVHGIPNDYKIKDGDLVSLDIGMFYKGFHTDMAWTVLVQSARFAGSLRRARLKVKSEDKEEFLEAGKKALRAAIMVACPGNRVGHISKAIEKTIKEAGYSSIEALTGHGIGKKLHEDPPIPCFLRGKIKKTPLLKPGMTLAIEIIYTKDSPDIVLSKDQWTIKTVDGKLAGLFEETIVIRRKGTEIITSLNRNRYSDKIGSINGAW